MCKTRHFKTVGPFCPEVPLVWKSLSSLSGGSVCRSCCGSGANLQLSSPTAHVGFSTTFSGSSKVLLVQSKYILEVFTDLEPKLAAGFFSLSLVNGF